jgi:predicted transcriptional regulator
MTFATAYAPRHLQATDGPTSVTATVAGRAEKLRNRRHEAGVMLADLARKTGYDVLYLLEIENGSTEVHAHSYSRIAAAIAELVHERRRS